MPRYDKNNTKELEKLIYDSYAHDSTLRNVEYDSKQDSIKIELLNPIFNTKTDLTFRDIITALAIKGDWPGSRETVVSLTVEKDFSYLQNYLPKHSEHMKDSIYLLFQMFSGDELHVVSKEVIAESIKPEDSR